MWEKLFGVAMEISDSWVNPVWWLTWYCRPMWGAGWQCWAGAV
jgi:hypothetical protein